MVGAWVEYSSIPAGFTTIVPRTSIRTMIFVLNVEDGSCLVAACAPSIVSLHHDGNNGEGYETYDEIDVDLVQWLELDDIEL
jgi:hypothetical protein